MEKTYDVVVIGGGASGMMAAIVAAETGASVLLLEKNKRLGEKLRITGGGRCNITNAELDTKILLKNYGLAEKYLYSTFHRFGVQDTIDFFENRKLPIKIEAKNRAFPESEKASDVIHCLINQLDATGVVILKSSAVTAVEVIDNKIVSVSFEGGTARAQQFVLATGGLSRPETGSTGDGFSWLKDFGHKLRAPKPNITPLATKPSWNVATAGNKLKNVSVTFSTGNENFSIQGDVLLTHFGVSGPDILNNAYRVEDLLQSGAVQMRIDCFPQKSHKDLDVEIRQVFDANGAKLLKNVLSLISPVGIAAAMVELLEEQVLESKVSEIGKDARLMIGKTLKALPLEVEGLMGFERAVVADGGVSLDEVDMRTMRSKIIDNLYITGDLLDITRPSGGYSLQLCWTSGYIAGQNAAAAAKMK